MSRTTSFPFNGGAISPGASIGANDLKPLALQSGSAEQDYDPLTGATIPLATLGLTQQGQPAGTYNPLLGDQSLEISPFVSVPITGPNLYDTCLGTLQVGLMPLVTAGSYGVTRMYSYSGINYNDGTIQFIGQNAGNYESLIIHDDDTYEFKHVEQNVKVVEWSDILTDKYEAIRQYCEDGDMLFVHYVTSDFDALVPFLSGDTDSDSAIFQVAGISPFIYSLYGVNILENIYLAANTSTTYEETQYQRLGVQPIVYSNASQDLSNLQSVISDYGGFGDYDGWPGFHGLTVLLKDVNGDGSEYIPLYPTELREESNLDITHVFRSVPDDTGLVWQVQMTEGVATETSYYTSATKVFTTSATFTDIDNCVNAGLVPILMVGGTAHSYMGYDSTRGHRFVATTVQRHPSSDLLPQLFFVSRSQMFTIKSGGSWVQWGTQASNVNWELGDLTYQSEIDTAVRALHDIHNSGTDMSSVNILWNSSDISLGFVGRRLYHLVGCSKPTSISTNTEHVEFLLACPDSAGIHFITFVQDTVNTFTTTDVGWGGGSPFDYEIFADQFDDTENYGDNELLTYNDKLWRTVDEKAAGAWNPNKVTETSVEKELGRIANNYTVTEVNSEYTVRNNAKSSVVHSSANDITIGIELTFGEIPNVVVEIDATFDVDVSVVLHYRDPNNIRSPSDVTANYSYDAGKHIDGSHAPVQLTCVGNCWTWARFVTPSP